MEKDLESRWTVFFFYLADFSFICPTELEDLQNKHQKFKDIGCEIYSVSTDSHYAQRPGTMNLIG